MGSKLGEGKQVERLLATSRHYSQSPHFRSLRCGSWPCECLHAVSNVPSVEEGHSTRLRRRVWLRPLAGQGVGAMKARLTPVRRVGPLLQGSQDTGTLW